MLISKRDELQMSIPFWWGGAALGAHPALACGLSGSTLGVPLFGDLYAKQWTRFPTGLTDTTAS